ncbi:KH domain-containing, RNA-binding, signal transduction-associated protein 2-like [Patiria miniata]|uniref:K Homology domain-containing protein n=1 Tax=Patiria miniata TaxID=46514 RepID=A0A913ZZ19_PATMI|nr:KH domain-containing, RNA-binding, signal transduction-associated protein 2-like [Patiria miniata]
MMETSEDRSARIKQFKEELEELDLTNCPCATKLINEEIKRLESGTIKPPKYVDIITDKPLKLEVRVLIPVNEHPKFNFVGKLLGPRGNSLKRMQEMTGTRMSILGRGSLRDKKKEDELREEGAEKNAHLNDDLHVLIEVFAPAADAYNRMAYGISEVRKYLIPDPNDEIRQSQLRELALISGSYTEVPPGPGRGFANVGGGGSRGGISPPSPMGRGGGGAGGGGAGGGGGGPPNMPSRFPAPQHQPPQGPGRSFPGPPGGAGTSPSPSVRGGPGGGRGGYQGGFGRQQQPPPSGFNSGRMGPPPAAQQEYNEGYSPRGSDGYSSSGGSAGYQGMGSDNNFGPSGYGGGANNGQSWGDSGARMKAPSPFAPHKDDSHSTSDLLSDSSLETRWMLIYASSKQGHLAFVTPRDLSTKERDVWELFFKSRLP